ncbi:MAG: DUF3047 domain-containing protein [Rhodothermaceae bacterium]|nr:DUF3047 domain-containing protein [Rhodothermaceae bacterium]
MIFSFLPIVALFMMVSIPIMDQPSNPPQDILLIDDFEEYKDGELPLRWKYLEEHGLVQVEPHHMRPDEEFFVVQEGGNKFLRAFTEGEAVHLSMANDEDFNWSLKSHPYLSWDWRANKLPEGASEDNPKRNDAGLGFYVTFDFKKGLFKRPISIKYTYSSSLDVGTVLKQGTLRVIVVSNGKNGYGDWEHIERNVWEDYRKAFGKNPPERPLSIRLWSDSDDTGQIGEGDFDNIKLAVSPR